MNIFTDVLDLIDSRGHVLHGPVRLVARLQVDRDREGRVSELEPVLDPGPEVKLVPRDLRRSSSGIIRRKFGQFPGNPDDSIVEQNRVVSRNSDDDVSLPSSSGSFRSDAGKFSAKFARVDVEDFVVLRSTVDSLRRSTRRRRCRSC